MDPNSQDVKHAEALSLDGKLAQAAIPAVLTGFSVFAKSDEGAQQVLSKNNISLGDLFMDKEDKVIRDVAQYAGSSEAEAESTMEKITQVAISITLAAAEARANCRKDQGLPGRAAT